MKRTLIQLSLILLASGLARAQFNPVPLTPDSFTADVVVEAAAAKPIADFTTATMDGGTNNNSQVWFEIGFDATRPSTGIPLAGSTFAAVGDPNRTFQMPPSYGTSNAVLLTTSGATTGSLILTTPSARGVLSILGSVSGGNPTIDYVVHYQGGATQPGQIVIKDWFNGDAPTTAYIANGRVDVGNGQTGTQFGNNPRLHFHDIFLSDAVTPVTRIDFTTASENRVALFGLSGSTDFVTYSPIPVTGFTYDMVVENTAPLTGSLYTKCNVIMDSGATNLTGNTWYEIGFNKAATNTGIPAAGSSVSGGTPLHTFTMAPTYTANNVVYIGNYEGYTTGTLTLQAPAIFTGLSFLNSAGNGPVGITVTVFHADATSEAFSFNSPDWFGGANPFYTAAGRFNPSSLALNNVNETNPRLYTNDIVLANTTSPVTSIQFSYASGSGRSMIFAVAGQSTLGGVFSPVAVTGYTADGVVEASAFRFPNPLYTSTTATMDGGTNFTGGNNNLNTWYERGYYRNRPDTGLPPAGSTLTSLALPDHHYQMPASYAGNNAIFVDATFTNANLRLASPATYSALSFLSTCANGRVTNQVIMQYQDGTSETNMFISQDWFGATPYAFTSRGRTDVNRRTVNNVGSDNPRLYEAQFALANTASPITNVVLQFLGAQNPASGRMFVFAVSGTAGAVPPIISSVSVSSAGGAVYEGSNVVFNAVITGGTPPFTYQWQKGTNGVYVDVVDGPNVSGATTTNMTITASISDMADYRIVVANAVATVNSGIATLSRVLSTLPDISAPNDAIQIYAGNTPFANETVIRAIDNSTSKYLSVDPDDVAPFDPVGFVVKPSSGNTILKALRIYTANDADNRDPASYTLEGSLDGGAFFPIASGPLALPTARNDGGLALNPLTQNLQEVHFLNNAGYNYYRVTFNTIRGGGTLMQIGEIEFLGLLNPNSAPNFVVAPTNTAANEGTTATFYSSAAGAAPITYQWYDVTAGEPGVAMGGQTSANLVLPSVTTAQNGSLYRVVATNPFGSVTNPAPVSPAVQLTVISGPIVINQDLPPESLFYVGRTVSMSVNVSGTAPAYQWQKDGMDLSDNAKYIGTQSNVLTIVNIQQGDAGVYSVLSSNEFSGVVPSTASTVYVTPIPTFHGNGVGWTMNNGSVVLSDVLYVTSAGNQRTSGFFNAPMYIGSFMASFTYLENTPGAPETVKADGFAFVMHNSESGAAALGGGGGALGYAGITPSAALLFNIYTTDTLERGIAFRTNGVTGAPYAPTTPVDIAGGNPIQVDLHYVNGILQVSLSNTVTAATFVTNLVVGNIEEHVGGSTAYIGITGASGGIASSQQVSNFRYIPLPPLRAGNSGSSVALTWPASVGGYSVQSKADLTTGIWSDVAATITQTNGNNRVLVSPAGNGTFYRLKLPTTP